MNFDGCQTIFFYSLSLVILRMRASWYSGGLANGDPVRASAGIGHCPETDPGRGGGELGNSGCALSEELAMRHSNKCNIAVSCLG